MPTWWVRCDEIWLRPISRSEHASWLWWCDDGSVLRLWLPSMGSKSFMIITELVLSDTTSLDFKFEPLCVGFCRDFCCKETKLRLKANKREKSEIWEKEKKKIRMRLYLYCDINSNLFLKFVPFFPSPQLQNWENKVENRKWEIDLPFYRVSSLFFPFLFLILFFLFLYFICSLQSQFDLFATTICVKSHAQWFKLKVLTHRYVSQCQLFEDHKTLWFHRRQPQP